jgi:3-oxoacyl-[acyl-carrier-protein] synthase-3
VSLLNGGVAIAGVGHHLPDLIEDNYALCQNLDVSPNWIVEKTGIKRRYLASPGDCASDYAARAAKNALEMAGIQAVEVDLIVVCTFSGDYIFPPVSAKVQMLLNATHAQIFDLQANCAGFVAGLTTASDRMKVDPEVRHALVIGVELNSRYIDRTDVNSAIYMSDGASAALLARTEAGSGIMASAFHTDSSSFEAVRMRGGGSSFTFRGRTWDPAVDFIEMNGIATWKQAVTHLPNVIRKACNKSGVNPSEVDLVIFHQSNLNMIHYLVRKLGYGLEKTFTNVEEIGNTGSASVGIALSEAVAAGKLKSGQLVVLAAVGAGFNFGASVWRWEMPRQKVL